MTGSESRTPVAQPESNPQLPRRLAIATILALVLVFILATGLMRTGAGNASGPALSGTPSTRAATRKTLRIATLNIHSGVGRDGRRDLDRTAQALRGFDIVALNEVRGTSLFGGQDQAHFLAQKLAIPCLFAPAERQWWHDSFGNAVLCNMPVTHWNRNPLPGSFGRGYKNIVTLRLPFAGRNLTVLVTHIDRQKDRESQLRIVVDRFLEAELPAILLGDFNTRADDVLFRALLASAPPSPGPFAPVAPPPRPARGPTPGSAPFPPAVAPLWTSGLVPSPAIDPFPPQDSPDRVDWILLRGLKCRDAGIIDTPASDHPLLWVEVEPP